MKNLPFVMLAVALLFAFTAFDAETTLAQTTKWVDQAAGDDNNDGNTEGTAYKTIQFAIDNSTSGTASAQSIINVKDGTYPGILQQTGFGFDTYILIKNKNYLTIQAAPGASPKVLVTAVDTGPCCPGGISIEKSDYVTIDNIDTKVHTTWDNIALFDANFLTVRNSRFEGGRDGIDSESDLTNLLVEKNEFTFAREEALDFKDHSYSHFVIQDNLFHADNRTQIRLKTPGTINDVIIRRNMILGTDKREAVLLRGAKDITIENNVFMNSAMQGLLIDANCQNINVWHNTFFNNAFETILTKESGADIVIKNNIIYGNGTFAAISANTPSLPGEDFNLIINTGVEVENVQAQAPITSFGGGTIFTDPIFVSTTAGSEVLHLQLNSPAIGAGIDLGVTNDIEKKPRPQPAGSNPDLGAYEHSLSSPLPLHVVFLAEKKVKIEGQISSEGDIHSNDKIEIKKGNPSTHTGNLTAVGKIDIKKNNSIFGNVTAGGELKLEGNAAIIPGPGLSNTTVETRQLPTLSFVAGGSKVKVKKKRSMSLAPGSYGDVKVEKAGTLELSHDGSTGEYFFKKLELEDKSKLSIDVTAGPVTINTTKEVDFEKNSEVEITPNGDEGSIFVTFNSMNEVTMHDGARVLGTIIAPDHKVELKKDVSFKGAIIAKEIEVRKDNATFLHHTSATALPKSSASLAGGGGEKFTTLPTDYELSQNYPNPFNPTTTIQYAVPAPGFVTLSVYNVLGQEVGVLVQEHQKAGWHAVAFNAEDQSSGVYFYRLSVALAVPHDLVPTSQHGQVENFVATKKLLLLK